MAGMTFRCNICDAQNTLKAGGFLRDEPSCNGCGSSARLRAMMNALSIQLFGVSVALSDFPVLKSVRGLGLSDNRECADVLAVKFDYRNTFYHQQPHLDIAAIPSTEQGVYDFVLAGEVFEHVSPPVLNSLSGTCTLLKPGGFLLITVPYSTEATTLEHFPDLKDHKVISVGDHLALVNRTLTGEWQVFDNLVFHGGPGSTLELRLFSEAALRKCLLDAGFERIRYITEDYAQFGIVHEGPWGLPVVAERECFRLSRASIAEAIPQIGLQADAIKRLEAERLRLERLCRELSVHLEKLTADLEERGRWAQSLDEEIGQNREEIARLQAYVEELRTRAQSAADEISKARGVLSAWEVSRWSHLGRALGLGPKLPG
jgi:SAM-dependent methyltransferase